MPLIYEIHWLPIRYRIEFKILLITLRFLKFLVPIYLLSLIYLMARSKYNLRTLNQKLHQMTVPLPVLHKLWIVLPFDIRGANRVSIFKAQLKTDLFRNVFLS